MQATNAPTVVGGSSKSNTNTTTKDSNIQSMETGGTVKMITTVAVATNTLVTDKRNGNTARPRHNSGSNEANNRPGLA